ncbi:hypothetical protein THICB1_110024 [Thiomonas arsenitoxydans]|uniref:Uncharacterized protein n=1 Tax=Thiomonas arsenitoxydans (strain DSM 22701 / CIP 110005 / 3As) TaxID=426114 RepID=A0ABP1YYZ2_THIA3|nr:hypothetical protein THICB1_110024 [Thiomonas arsenitoxydans]CQR29359.1 hypothetical protein THICB6_150091 [Thiomonas arsenitoxydans]CQR41068.1 hypothetical protein ACO3_70051 [Thiomonas arsenitoxydans]CQR41160.1 hypothetical protein ACO7_70051 [Thiomonas arsenitoxydans]
MCSARKKSPCTARKITTSPCRARSNACKPSMAAPRKRPNGLNPGLTRDHKACKFMRAGLKCKPWNVFSLC